MDFSPLFQTPLTNILACFLALLFLYASFKTTNKAHHKNKINKKTNINDSVPEPPRSLPLIGHLHLLGNHRRPVTHILGDLADELGPIYSLRLGHHRALVLSSWEHVKECLTTHDRLFANRPPIAVAKFLCYDGAAFAISPYGQYWRDVRKLVTLRLLSAHRVQSLRHVISAEVGAFIHGLAAAEPNGVAAQPLSELIERLTFNLNARLIVGKRFSAAKAGEDGLALRFKKAVKEALYLSGVFVWSDAIPWLEFLDIHGHVSSMKRVFKELDAVLSNWLEDHRRDRDGDDDINGDRCNVDESRDVSDETVETRDLMDVMLSSIAEDDPMVACYNRDTVIKATALILMLTGTESTAISLIWAVSLLLNNPSVLKAAQKELDTQVGRDRWVQESDITNLSLLQAILKETYRLYPPGPITGPREATDDCHVGGYHIPKGTRLIVNIWKLQRDPRMWAHPLEFQPQRFLTEHSDLSLGGQNFEYIPFSSGRRGCPGMGLGLVVVQLVLARLVQGFDMVTKDGKGVDMREGVGLALPKLNPLEVVLSPRLPKHLYECL